ncbi:CubicO group peptidase (beta-lactamase class C family) [Hephaestia caeni]|uniref:CubicO group peptidase (Beta-lactamase class C family) n=1 Tax=Hephaestia caeni TaxID=645617 RepID=A0A397PI03_9SPHN|nr:serine hydrolase domain-containing protein [Hephaestia caeni]RIA46905.1 CubicO group peptidase (beta-lactamase class C family) [Hephaestia caeni]
MKPFRSAVAALALFVSVPAFAQALTAEESQQIDTLVTTTLADTGVPSASVAIVRGGKIVFTKAWGKQSLDIAQARTDVPYQIASISKQFTAAALLLLEDQGKLTLDDPVSKYVPGITQGDHITIRQLLSHTSGLQDYWPQDYSFAAMEHPVTPQQIVDRWAKKPLDFPPGTQWQYSNTGYVVAGMIVEKVSGTKLLDFLKAHIFSKLDMHPINQDLAIGKGYPVGYHRYALGPVRPEKPAAPGWLYAAGELAMTASDLAKWDIARIDRTVLPADDWAAQETAILLTNGKDTGYGLGVDVGEKNGHAYVEHSGEAVGFLSENIVFPKDKAAVVVFVNSDFSNAFLTITQGIVKTAFPAIANAAADTDETVKTAEARKVYDQLVTGTLDRTLMTEDANYYFTDEAQKDYQTSLSALGEPVSFEPRGSPKLRGGFVYRGYTVTYPDRKLSVSTYAEPGENGRYEQFLVAPMS